MSDATNKINIDSICDQLAETQLAANERMFNVMDGHHSYLKINIEAIIQGQKDMKSEISEIKAEVMSIKHTLEDHDSELSKLRRYASIENTGIRIALAVLLSVIAVTILRWIIW